jgi:type II secretory pathway component PulL
MVSNKLMRRTHMPKTKGSYECLLSMRDLGKYVGKWIALVDEEVVFVGKTGKEALKVAREKYPDKSPLILKVPSSAVMLL